jgi:hypothetical protein
MWLVVVDTMQIQPYIFGSNRLRENVGASYLVDLATRDWAFEAVRAVAPGNNNIGYGNNLISDVWIEKGQDAEVFYSGGGNFVVLFSYIEKVKQFNSHLSQRVLLEAPGLQLLIAQQKIDWSTDVLYEKLDEVLRILAVQKRNQVWSAPLLGLGVTAACRSTGLPATGITRAIGNDPGYLASDEIRAKVDVATSQQGDPSLANRRLQGTVKLPVDYGYPSDFEDLGATTGEYSYMAIVHADGNGMGQRTREIGEQYVTADKNRDFVLALRKFSTNVQLAVQNALQVVVDRLTSHVCDKDGEKFIVYEPNPSIFTQIKLVRKDNYDYLPFRPIVFGGDDVTFVCDGRLGLSLATEYLREFEQQTSGLGKNGSRLTACAGIAIIKNHYPFARAYALAADLVNKAKSYRTKYSIDRSCLDWHFALSGLSSSVEEIRNREYEVGAGSLTLRPVTLDINSWQAQHAWPVIRQGIEAFQQEQWVGRRNKIKALRDALREGPSAVEHFIVAFNNGDPLPSVLPEMFNWPLSGWQSGSCGYFDAIELADWFVPLKGEADATPTTPPAS